MPTGIQLEEIVKLATEAGKAILDVYGREDFEEEAKGDGSPLTLADRRAHAVIETGLRELTPDIPIACEGLIGDRWYKGIDGNQQDEQGRLVPYVRKG